MCNEVEESDEKPKKKQSKRQKHAKHDKRKKGNKDKKSNQINKSDNQKPKAEKNNQSNAIKENNQNESQKTKNEPSEKPEILYKTTSTDSKSQSDSYTLSDFQDQDSKTNPNQHDDTGIAQDENVNNSSGLFFLQNDSSEFASSEGEVYDESTSTSKAKSVRKAKLNSNIIPAKAHYTFSLQNIYKKPAPLSTAPPVNPTFHKMLFQTGKAVSMLLGDEESSSNKSQDNKNNEVPSKNNSEYSSSYEYSSKDAAKKGHRLYENEYNALTFRTNEEAQSDPIKKLKRYVKFEDTTSGSSDDSYESFNQPKVAISTNPRPRTDSNTNFFVVEINEPQESHLIGNITKSSILRSDSKSLESSKSLSEPKSLHQPSNPQQNKQTNSQPNQLTATQSKKSDYSYYTSSEYYSDSEYYDD